MVVALPLDTTLVLASLMIFSAGAIFGFLLATAMK